MRSLTQSELRCFRRCARAHHYRYQALRRPIAASPALRFGTLWHLAMASLWSGEESWAPPADAEPLDAVIASVLFCGYVARWGRPTNVIAVEQPFATPLVNPASGCESLTYSLAGKVDAIVAGPILVEHKTTSEDFGPGSAYWARLRLDAQISVYLDGCAALGHETDTCLYDVVRKPRHRPLLATPVESRKYTKAGALYAAQREHDEDLAEYAVRLGEAIAADPDSYYQRGTVVRLESERDDARYDTWQTARLIREAEIAKRWPRNPDACVLFGTCNYFGVCTGTENLYDDTRFRPAACEHEELSA